MNCVYRTIEKVAAQNHSVLIFGESGTGKALSAREIHIRGARKQGAFIPVDCLAISPSLIESELFGHVRGAFSGLSGIHMRSFFVSLSNSRNRNPHRGAPSSGDN